MLEECNNITRTTRRQLFTVHYHLVFNYFEIKIIERKTEEKRKRGVRVRAANTYNAFLYTLYLLVVCR